jgi:hypothetical protein
MTPRLARAPEATGALSGAIPRTLKEPSVAASAPAADPARPKIGSRVRAKDPWRPIGPSIVGPTLPFAGLADEGIRAIEALSVSLSVDAGSERGGGPRSSAHWRRSSLSSSWFLPAQCVAIDLAPCGAIPRIDPTPSPGAR